MEDLQAHWVGVNLVFGGGLQPVARLRGAFASIDEAFRARPERLTGLGFEKDKVRALQNPRTLDRARREIERLDKRGIMVLTPADAGYPEYLREIYDPPSVLYCEGEVETLKGPAVALVGSRRPTAYGRALAERLGEDLAARGLVVVSGLARGIDSLSHWGALKGGKTVAVLGSGLENIYPPENARLYRRIVENGAVISEFPPDAPPLGFHFPLRNRIISGLSLALVVVEAARRSGSLISARLALEQNREVMAVPGNVTSELSRGTNWLIRTGAKPIESWEDIAEELPPEIKRELIDAEPPSASSVSLNKEEQCVLDLLASDAGRHIDEIVENGGLSVSEALSTLLSLELKGVITQRPGKIFQRKL